MMSAYNPLFESIFEDICRDAKLAFEQAKPTPMIVGQAVSLVGGGIVPGTEEYVADGVCGFAWITVFPATQPFARWLKKEKGCEAGYPKGLHLSFHTLVPEYGGSQSMQRKEAAMKAAATRLKEYGIKCYAQSRID